MNYLTIALTISIVAISTSVYAEKKLEKTSKVEDMIKFRQSGMMFMRWNMEKIKKQVVKNPQAYSQAQVLASAKVIAAIANSGLYALFSPETGSGKGWKETRVKSEYFSQTDEVEQRYRSFIEEANEMVEVSGTGDVNKIKGQFKTLLNACKACHQDYRAK